MQGSGPHASPVQEVAGFRTRAAIGRFQHSKFCVSLINRDWVQRANQPVNFWEKIQKQKGIEAIYSL